MGGLPKVAIPMRFSRRLTNRKCHTTSQRMNRLVIAQMVIAHAPVKKRPHQRQQQHPLPFQRLPLPPLTKRRLQFPQAPVSWSETCFRANVLLRSQSFAVHTGGQQQFAVPSTEEDKPTAYRLKFACLRTIVE